MIAILLISESALPLAETLRRELADTVLYSHKELPGCTAVPSFSCWLSDHVQEYSAIVFIGALGICVRTITPCLHNKYTDPAVVCVDTTGRYAIPVLSGHIGGANELSRRIAALIGGEAVVTTQSDNMGLWALDTLARQYGWQTDATRAHMNRCIFLFVGQRPTALLLEVRDRGTAALEKNLPAHVRVFYRLADIPQDEFELLIAVTPFLPVPGEVHLPALYYYPPVLHLGMGCKKQCCPDGVADYIAGQLTERRFAPQSVASISTITLKQDEPLLRALHKAWPQSRLHVYPAEELADIEVPHPSEQAFRVTGLYGVAEAAALKSGQEGPLLIDKQKGSLQEGHHFTFAVCLDRPASRCGHIEIVGAGPGDPELVSVRGRRFLEQADLILYAGSLVPVELTACAKNGATVRSSASLTLEEQFELMKSFYDRGLLVVRLHTGDPCIYGAIQEQMAFFDRHHMSYHITPGISSFQAAAAALRSQFTIPEKVQTIILTRGEGRTPMPEKEQLHLLARSQSTLCIYLSAGIVEKVQEELLQAYPPETPVAACYKLTWKEERIYRGQLKDLARLVRDNGLTLTTLLVVGEAIDNRRGLSRLYAHDFHHLYRP